MVWAHVGLSNSVNCANCVHADTQEAQVSASQQLDARLAQKLKSQIRPSRIPHIPLSKAAEAATAHAQHMNALQPTSQRKHRKQHDQAYPLQDDHDRQQQHKQLSQGHTSTKSNSSCSSQQHDLPRQLHEQQHRASSTAGELQPWTPRLTQQQQQQQSPREHSRVHAHAQSKYPHRPQHDLSPHRQQQQQQQQHDNHNHSNSNKQHAGTAAATPSGWSASLKMHEFLMAQQRKREQYWLAKYGKMLLPPAAAQAVGKPSRNPTSLFR
jgi:hypothetical protein